MEYDSGLIKALIVDDEASGRKVLAQLLSMKHPEVELLAAAKNIEEAINAIDLHKPNLVFLDIKMGKREGFEVLEKTIFKDYHVVFVTAHDEFALRAIKVSALDYLLKPVGIAELAQALERYRKRSKDQNQASQLQLLAESLKAPKKELRQRISLLTKDGYELVPVQAIHYLVADHNYTEVHVEDGQSRLVSRNLGHFEEQLQGFDFMRIHKSHIVNLDQIRTYVPGNGGFVIMQDGRRFEVSRRKKTDLLQLLNLETL